MVRIKVKKGALEKETKAVWSEEVYKIEIIVRGSTHRSTAGVTQYRLEGSPKTTYLRHELLKVEGDKDDSREARAAERACRMDPLAH